MSNGTVLITGASSGIGAAFARRFAREGHDLILVGRRRDRLEAVASGARAAGPASGLGASSPRVRIVEAELADPAALAGLERLAADTPDLVGLVNNAGFGLDASFLDARVQDQAGMLTVHNMAPLRLCRAAIPVLLARGGFIINVSSLAAFTPVPGDAVYSATKSFLNNFTESLHMGLADKGLRVQALCPGFTRTDFHAKLGLERRKLYNRGYIRWMDADRVVDISLRQLGKKVVCIPGAWNRVLYRFVLLLPRRLYYRLMKSLYGSKAVRAEG